MTTLSTEVDARLIRAYRRLVLIYPAGPRREELLDTLIECAPAGRRRPTVREVGNVLWHGHRAQFGRPGRHGIVVLALFVAMAAGFLGAAAGNRIGWEAVGPLPTGAAADEISRTVFPGLRVQGGGDAAKIVSQSDGEGVEAGYAVSWVKHTEATRDVLAYTAAARARLEAAGWRVTGVDPPFDRDHVGANPDDNSDGFTAERGDLGLRFSDSYWAGLPAYDGDGAAMYHVWHLAPSWLDRAAWAGAAIAAVLAWFLTAWVSRTLETVPALSSPAAAGAVAFVVGLIPAALAAIPGEDTASETVAPFWQHLFHLGLFPAVLSALFATALVMTALVLRARHLLRHIRLPRRRTALLTAGAVVLALTAYNVVPGTCSPVVPSGIEDPPSAAMSYESRIFIAPGATDDQRNLAQAAIGRGMGGGFTFNAGTRSPGFTDAFCGHGRVRAPVAATLPWYWTVDLASPGMFQGMAAEVSVMPGVVAVQHLPGSFEIIGS